MGEYRSPLTTYRQAGSTASQTAAQKRQRQLQALQPRRPWPAMLRSFVLLLVLPVAIFGGVIAYSHFTESSATPTSTAGELVWAGGKVIFSDKSQLEAWLREHGGSLEAFEKNHPGAIELMAASTTSANETTPAVPTFTVTKVSSSRHTVVWLFAALGLVLGAFSLLPLPVVDRLGLTPLAASRDLRFSTGAIGVALLAGVVVQAFVG